MSKIKSTYSDTLETDIVILCELITQHQQQRLKEQDLDCEHNLRNAIAHHHIANKYTRIDIGDGGRYMVENLTGIIFGIKAYGQIHRGHQYGTLATIQEYNWGGYTATKLKGI